jgi:uncharacterized protein (DUF433 family)
MGRNCRIAPTVNAEAEGLAQLHAQGRQWQNESIQSTHPLISVDPQRRGGRPCIRDLRISVGDVLGWLAQGMTVGAILAEYPELTQADFQACLS